MAIFALRHGRVDWSPWGCDFHRYMYDDCTCGQCNWLRFCHKCVLYDDNAIGVTVAVRDKFQRWHSLPPTEVRERALSDLIETALREGSVKAAYSLFDQDYLEQWSPHWVIKAAPDKGEEGHRRYMQCLVNLRDHLQTKTADGRQLASLRQCLQSSNTLPEILIESVVEYSMPWLALHTACEQWYLDRKLRRMKHLQRRVDRLLRKQTTNQDEENDIKLQRAPHLESAQADVQQQLVEVMKHPLPLQPRVYPWPPQCRRDDE